MTMINPKILILPDIHGRTFYQKALCEAVYNVVVDMTESHGD